MTRVIRMLTDPREPIPAMNEETAMNQTLPRPPARSAARIALLAVTVLAASLWLASGRAWAATPSPAWSISGYGVPTILAPGSSFNSGGGSNVTSSPDQYTVVVTNTGAQQASGGAILITDQLPPGLTVDAPGLVALAATSANSNDDANNTVACQPDATDTLVTCTDAQDAEPLQPGQRIVLQIPVDVAANASGTLTSTLAVSGGGAPTATANVHNTAGSATPPFALEGFSMSATGLDGQPYTQAGGHPYQLTTNVDFSTVTAPDDNVVPDENAHQIRVDLPAGLVGDPNAVPQCPLQEFYQSGVAGCPADTQVGILEPHLSDGVTTPLPVYNLVPPPGEPAQLGAHVLQYPVFIDTGVRTGGDYGISATAMDITANAPLVGTTLTLWGVPADPSHNAERWCQGAQFSPGCTTSAATTPFLTMPTSCPGSPLSPTLSADSWQHLGSSVSRSADLPATSGCGQLTFDPSISVRPDTSVADSPSGLSVDLKVPQNYGPLPVLYGNGPLFPPTGVDYSPLATANLKRAVVTLPPGTSVDPSAANGLAACSPAQIGMNDSSEPSCPDASKIGSVEVRTPLLADPLEGSVYVAQQNQNPFGSLLAIYVTAEADGVLVKLAGHVIADPVTGQLQTIFDNNPQLPFSDFKLDFFGGPRGVLATPESCGTYTTTSDLTPWNGGPDNVSSDQFTINSGCVSGFSPSFTAGTQNPQAGAYSPFVLSFSRSDTDQDLSGLTVKLPPGVAAKLAGVGECSDADLAAAAAQSGAAEQASSSCPADSQVGTVTTGSGPGPDSVFLPGKAYLTGPYKGAPYGLAVVVPAVAGPYDLGTVVVRQALYIDPTTAQVTAVSDPFPTILQGIPLRLRRIDVDLNRPDFTINPTNCDPMAVSGILSSTGGLSYTGSSRFQVGGCQALGFSPKLAFKLTGKGQTHSGNHPTLTATLTQPGGQANIHTARVALPLSMALDPNNSQHVCNYQVAQAVHGGAVGCPASTIVGTATAVTPLLSQPLTGPVYLVQGIRFNAQGQAIHTLPSLLIPLRGQIALDLRAQSSVSGGKLVTTFSSIPDAPVSKFTLTITGGPKGLLVITGRGRTICGKQQVATGRFGAQSGKTDAMNPTLSTPACGKPASLRAARVVGHAVHLTVRVPAAGRLVARGAGLRPQVRRPGRAGTVSLVLDVSPAAAAKLNRTNQLSTRVTVNWTPRGGGLHSMTTGMLTIRR